MKTLKNIYKIVLAIVFIIIFSLGVTKTSFAVTQPSTAPDGGSWKGWFCAKAGQAYWYKYQQLHNDSHYKYKEYNTITKSSDDGKGWHILGYILNWAEEKGTQFRVNHYTRSGVHHIGDSTSNDRAAQSALWKAINKYSLGSTLGSGNPSESSMCSCGNSLFASAESSWNNGNPTTRYEYEITIWRDTFYKVYGTTNYRRQPLLKIENVEIKTTEVKVKFYKKDGLFDEGLEGAKIKVTAEDATIVSNGVDGKTSKEDKRFIWNCNC